MLKMIDEFYNLVGIGHFIYFHKVLGKYILFPQFLDSIYKV